MILVSHDRYFLDRLTDHLFVFQGDGKIKDFYGGYSAYRLTKEKEEREYKQLKAQERKPAVKKEKPRNQKLSFNEKREYEALEKEIEALETEKTALEKAMNSGKTDYQELEKKASRVAELINLIDEKTFRWMELEEKKEIVKNEK